MNLWLSSYFLVVGLFVCSAAPTPEECPALVSPVSSSKMFGSWHMVAGYTEGDLFTHFMKLTESSKLKITNSSDGVVEFSEVNKLRGKCFHSVAEVKVEGDKATVSMMNITSVFHVLSSSDDSLVFDIHSTIGDLDQVLRFLNISVSGAEGTKAHSLYLMGRGLAVTELDLEHFKHQASCLGFSTEPHFQPDLKRGFCTEEQSVKLAF